MDKNNFSFDELLDDTGHSKEEVEIALNLLKDNDVSIYLRNNYPYFLGGAGVALGNRIPFIEIPSSIREDVEQNIEGAVKIWDGFRGEQSTIAIFVVAYFGVEMAGNPHDDQDFRIVLKPKEFEEELIKDEVIGNSIANYLMGKIIPGFSLMARSEKRAEKHRKDNLYNELSSNILYNTFDTIFEYFDVKPKIDFDELFEEYKQKIISNKRKNS